ncbi:MAG TPA: hypothetical protein VGQ33_17865 [Vicinamibacteria bacterium]|nr:hypothetical protein [Vicinamibacteria bacterium]
MRTAGRALAAVLIVGNAGTALEAAPPSRPVALYVSTSDDAVPAELSPAGQAAVRRAEDLRARFLAALRKTKEVLIVNDEAAADARVEIREAAVHEARATEDTRRPIPGRPAGTPSGGRIGTADTDVAVNQVRDLDYALTVRVSTAHFFADCSSDPRDTSAASAVGTVMGKLKQWIGTHHRELILPRTP